MGYFETRSKFGVGKFRDPAISRYPFHFKTMDKIENGETKSVGIKTTLTKDFQYHAITTLYIAVFYFSGVVVSTTSKVFMTSYPFPLLLCTIQLGISGLFVILYLKCMGLRKHGYPSTAITRLVAATGAVFALGFVCMNSAMQWCKYNYIFFSFGIYSNITDCYVSYIAHASFVETMRPLESFSTMILGRIFLQERSSTMTMFTLLPICGGVMLSCSNSVDFSMAGFIAMLLANVCFSGRSVLVRLIHQIDAQCMEPFNFYADLSMYGFIIMLPITAVMEGTSAASAFMSPSPAVLDATGGVLQLLPILLLNTLAYSAGAVASLLLLQRTDLIIHTVISGFRRVFSIILTALYFGVLLNAANLTGVLIAVTGVLLFAYFKAKETSHK